MLYCQHNDEKILVPQHISQYGVYTSHIFIITACHAFYENDATLGSMLLFLYITSITNWAIVYRKSIIKQIDMTIAICSIIKISLYNSNGFHEYKNMWLHALYTSISVVMINKYIFYNKIYNTNSKLYCIPNTLCRENAYYNNVIIHILCLHIFLPIITLYCSISSKYLHA
jgi:hypothetical protein